VAWGLVSTFQAFQHGYAAFIITRLLLGLCESGFIPAGLFTITRWYKRDETNKRFTVFFLGNTLAQAISGLAAYGMWVSSIEEHCV
jgi:MFS family permease